MNYLVVSLVAGLLFAVLDGLIHANPLARKLFEVYAPLARERLNLPVGVLVDLAYGFLLAALYLLVSPSLPGESGLIKGLAYGLGLWFLRVAMATVSQALMYKIPTKTLAYGLIAGLAEMLVLGALLGAFLTA